MPDFKGFALTLLLLFFSHIQSLVELETVIVATTPYFEHTLTYSLWLSLESNLLQFHIWGPQRVFIPELHLLHTISLYISCTVSNFHGTEIEIWADFGPVGNTESC